MVESVAREIRCERCAAIFVLAVRGCVVALAAYAVANVPESLDVAPVPHWYRKAGRGAREMTFALAVMVFESELVVFPAAELIARARELLWAGRMLLLPPGKFLHFRCAITVAAMPLLS